MSSKTDRWESYTDKTGRQHWRWPATGEGQVNADGRYVGTQQPDRIGLPRQQQQAQQIPLRQRGK